MNNDATLLDLNKKIEILVNEQNANKYIIEKNNSNIKSLKLNNLIKIIGFLVVTILSFGFYGVGITGDLLANLVLLNVILWEVIGSIFNGTFYSNISNYKDLQEQNSNLQIENHIMEIDINELKKQYEQEKEVIKKAFASEDEMLNENINALRRIKFALMASMDNNDLNNENNKKLVYKRK